MATKAAHTAFNREVSKYLQSIGAEFQLTNSIQGTGKLKTIAGILHISLQEPERSDVFSIFCRFEDPEAASKFIDGHIIYGRLNEYSGKWNFHGYNADEQLAEFKEQIAPLLMNEKV